MKNKTFKKHITKSRIGSEYAKKQGKIIRESIREIRERYIQTPYT